MNRPAARLLAAAGLGAIVVLGAASTATAVPTNTNFTVTQPSVPVIPPGQTGTIALAITNTGPEATTGSTSFSNFTFTLPQFVTFANPTVTQTQPDNSTTGGPCTLSNGNRTITCPPGLQQVTNRAWPVGGVQTLRMQVTVDPAAPKDTVLGGGVATLTPNSADFTSTTPVDVQTVSVSTVPLLAIPVALGALALAGGGFVFYRRRAAGTA